VEKAGDAVAAIIAAGIIPAGLEMMDQPATRAVEEFVRAGYDLDAKAILLCESDGTPEEVEEEIGRMEAVLERSGATCTLNACSEALALSPWLGLDAIGRGFEISCHGYRWLSSKGMTEAEEREWIQRAVKTIAAACGVRPIGWHTRSPHTPNTRRLLIDEGGFLYDSDAYDDDLPYLVDVGGGRQHVVLPYSLDTNDMRCQRPEAGFVRAQDFADYVIDAFDWLWEEGATSPKMMTVGLHLRTIGRPGRIAGLDRVLRHIRGKGGAWIARRDEIARHWLRLHGRASATPA